MAETQLHNEQTLRQEQTMSARQFQSLSLLHAPIQELRQAVDAILAEFKAQYNPHLALVVGDGGMKAEDFLSINPVELFK